MPRKKTRRQRVLELTKLLHAIHTGRKHTHRNTVLAPLSQADLVRYDYPPKGWPAQNVRLTDNGVGVMEFNIEQYGFTEEELKG